MKALFLGLGSVGQRHLRAWTALTEARAFAVRSGFGPQVDADLYEPVSSIEEAARAGAKVAFICNPTALHIESALRCAACGMDLFIEKPIGSHRKGWDELKSLVRRRKLVAYVAYPLRFHPLLDRIRKLLLAGELGRIYSACAFSASYLPAWRPGSDYRQSYSARADLGGGVLLDLSHEVDYLTWLFGPISGMSAQLAHVSDLDIQTEDHADILVRFRAGMLAQVHLDYYRNPARRDLEVVGARGTLQADLLGGEMRVLVDGNATREIHSVERDELYATQITYFLQCLQSRTVPMNNLTDAEDLWLRLLAIKEEQDEGSLYGLCARGL